MMQNNQTCQLCERENYQKNIAYEDENFVILFVLEQDFYPLLRIISKNHYKELSDLPDVLRQKLFSLINKCEQIFLQTTAISPKPYKINIASLGNYVPHLHFHVIARWQNDLHFPDSIWSPLRRSKENTDLKISVDEKIIRQSFNKNQ